MCTGMLTSGLECEYIHSEDDTPTRKHAHTYENPEGIFVHSDILSLTSQSQAERETPFPPFLTLNLLFCIGV